MEVIKKYVYSHKLQFIISVLFAIIGVILDLFTYINLADIIVNLINNNSNIEFYVDKCIKIIILFILKSIFNGVSTTISHTATFRALGEIRNDLANKLFNMPLGDILNRPSGEIKSIMIEQVDSMETTLAHIIPEFTSNLIGPIILFIYMLRLDWRLALLSLVPLVIGMLAMKSVINDSYQMNFKKSVEIGQAMNSSMVEYINGIEVIKNFNQSDKSYKKFADSVYNNAKFYYNWMGESNTKMSIGRMLSPMGILLIVPVGMIFYMNNSISVTNLITMIILSFGTVNSVLKNMNFMDDLARISTITDEIGKILDNKELTNVEKNINPIDFSIKLENVIFSYNKENKVLDDISLDIESGAVSALVGPSGGGKSTIAKLIAGFWNVDSGEIKIGDINIEDFSLDRLSSFISYVSQDNYLFDMSIRDNIRIGNPKATDKQVQEIAKKSGCHDFIINLSNGYDTIVGEGGSHISGGERQRITIARAMLKNAPIVILDEATSYIDPENEAIIQSAIKKLVQGKTLLVIAHRLRTIVNADRIFVIDNGKLDSFGTHEELLKSSSLYRDMFDASIRGDE